MDYVVIVFDPVTLINGPNILHFSVKVRNGKRVIEMLRNI